MLSYQGVAHLRRIGRRGLVGGSVSLWVSFEVSKPHAWPSSLSLCLSLSLSQWPVGLDVALSSQVWLLT